MFVTPAATPVTMPEEEPTVAIVPLPLVHKPPPVLFVKVVDPVMHTNGLPEIGLSGGFTVTVVVALQPVDNE